MKRPLTDNLGTFQSEISNKVGMDELSGIISAFVPYVFGVAGLFLLLYLIWGGFGFMTSGGDSKALEEARKKISFAILGFLIIFVAYWLVQLLALVLGIPQIKSSFGV